jgi:hypothetical protein
LWPLPDATPIAARLVTLLPNRGSETPLQMPTAHVTSLGKNLLERLPLRDRGARAKAATTSGPSAFILLLLAGLLVGLTLYMVVQRAPGDQLTGAPAAETQPAQRPAAATDSIPAAPNKGA